MDSQKTNVPSPPKPLRNTSYRFNLGYLSRTQSALADHDTSQIADQECSIFRRRLSLPMPADHNPHAPLRSPRKPNFQLELPPSHLSRTSLATALTTNKGSTDLSGQIDTAPRPQHNFVPAPLTPPDETSVIEFTTAQSHFPEHSSQGQSHRSPASPTSSLPTYVSLSTQLSPLPTPTIASAQRSDMMTGNTESSVFNVAIAVAVSSTLPSLASPYTIRVVYQALPYPITEHEDANGTSVRTPLVKALQSDATAEARYIHVTHALPERCPPGVVPSSPPVTPSGIGQPSDQQGYFAPRLTTYTAATMTDCYDQKHDDRSGTLPSTPSLAVPPLDTALSLFERVIPPSSGPEALDFWEPSGSSPLLGRLRELAPGGTLIIVHPTRHGGDTFDSKFLYPVLKNVLWKLINTQSLSADVGESLSATGGTRYLISFDNMKNKLKALLSRMGSEKSGETAQPFYLLHASTANVPLGQAVWTKWWAHQEKPRFEQYFLRYFRRGHALPTDWSLTPIGLAREFLEGVVKHKEISSEQMTGVKGVEVGVFVVKRAP